MVVVVVVVAAGVVAAIVVVVVVLLRFIIILIPLLVLGFAFSSFCSLALKISLPSPISLVFCVWSFRKFNVGQCAPLQRRLFRSECLCFEWSQRPCVSSRRAVWCVLQKEHSFAEHASPVPLKMVWQKVCAQRIHR